MTRTCATAISRCSTSTQRGAAGGRGGRWLADAGAGHQPFDRRYLLGTGLIFLSITSLILGLLPWKEAVFSLLPFVALAKHAMMLQLHVFTPEILPHGGALVGARAIFAVPAHDPHRGSLCGRLHDQITAGAHYLCDLVRHRCTATFFLPYDTRNKALGARYYENEKQQDKKENV